MLKIFAFLVLLVCPFLSYAQAGSDGPSVHDRIRLGADQWLAQGFMEAAPEHFDGKACRYRYSITDRPDTDQLLTISCSEWLRVKAMCELFFPLFDQELEAARLPEAYRFLALALSGLDRSASLEPGKAGIWNLSYPIARKYGLEVNDEIDERYAPDLATKAAVAYLTFLHERYDGNREKVALAFAHSVPYVEGMGSEKSEADKVFLSHVDALRVWHGGCPQNELLLDLIGLLNSYENVSFKQEISYDNLAAALEGDILEMRAANPIFIGQSIPANREDFPFLLPRDAFERMTALGDSLYTFEKEVEKPREEIGTLRLAPTGDAQTYVVRSGDVLGVIAERFGVRVYQIREWNGLRSDRIDVGQKLLIYSSSTPSPKPKASPKTKTSTDRAASSTSCTYTVKSGDSLWLIASRIPGVSSDDLQRWNKLGDDLSVGQKISTCAP